MWNSDTSTYLELVLGSNITTNPISYSYGCGLLASGISASGTKDGRGLVSSAGAVTVIAAPVAGLLTLQFFSLTNADSQPAVISLRWNNGVTIWPWLSSITLQKNQWGEYHAGLGWKFYDAGTNSK